MKKDISCIIPILENDGLQYFRIITRADNEDTKLIHSKEYVDPITKDEIQEALKQCKNKKAPDSSWP